MFRSRRSAASRSFGEWAAAPPGLWHCRHSPWVLRSQRCAGELAVALCVTVALSSSAALASDEGDGEPERRGFSFDLRLAAGGASAEFTESDAPVAAFEAVALGGSARFGWFVGPHVLLGAELGSSWHTSVGRLRLQDPLFFNRGLPADATFAAIAPLGVFVEVYPWRDAGWFAAIAGGVGWMDLPAFSVGSSNVYTSGYSLDVGYELSGNVKRGAAVFMRYSRWAGEEFIVSDHPDGLVSRELLVGLRWSFWTPEWQ